MLTRFIVAAVLVTASMTIALAAPARIIILRHGEKANKWKLRDTGEQRANALAANYLGRGAAKSLFASGDEPAFFFAIALHTLELASPAVASWNKPVILYSVVPEAQTKELNQRTQEAASNIMTNPALVGKTVVMVWEHKHIANAKLEAKFEGEAVTPRKLLKLDILPGMPDDTYDYFWIVDFPANSNVPSRFSMVKQEFGAPYAGVPSNDWDAPNGLEDASGCEIKDD
jgi:hypothetical protein